MDDYLLVQHMKCGENNLQITMYEISQFRDTHPAKGTWVCIRVQTVNLGISAFPPGATQIVMEFVSKSIGNSSAKLVKLFLALLNSIFIILLNFSTPVTERS